MESWGSIPAQLLPNVTLGQVLNLSVSPTHLHREENGDASPRAEVAPGKVRRRSLCPVTATIACAEAKVWQPLTPRGWPQPVLLWRVEVLFAQVLSAYLLGEDQGGISSRTCSDLHCWCRGMGSSEE